MSRLETPIKRRVRGDRQGRCKLGPPSAMPIQEVRATHGPPRVQAAAPTGLLTAGWLLRAQEPARAGTPFEPVHIPTAAQGLVPEKAGMERQDCSAPI